MTSGSARVHWVIQVALEATGQPDRAPTVSARAGIGELWNEALDLSGLSHAALAAKVAERFSLRLADFEHAEEQAIRFVPEKLARSGCVFPLRVTDSELVVATGDPVNLEVEEQLRFASGRRPVFEISSPTAIENMVEAHYRPESAAENLLTDLGAEAGGIHLVEESEVKPLDAEDASGEPVVKLSNLILREAISQRASDIHLAPGRSVGTVHLRVDGVLQLRMRIPMPVLHRVISRIKILGSMDIADRLRPQDGRARIRVEDRYYDLRISTVPTREAEKAVVRLLYSDTAPGIEGLEMPDADAERLRTMLAHRDSIVLVTGPTGSGKTTTLYAALQELNTGDLNIMTVEDPVEYELPGVTQIQVETKRGVTFASALRAILRQDPDIILLGEIRDAETAEIAVQAAQTGHLVLATLHTNDALGVVARLQDLGLQAASIADSVCGVVAQRLVRKLCSSCAAPVDGELTADEEFFAKRYGVRPTVRAVGCPVCDEIGYRGRRPVMETVLSSPALRQLVKDGAGVDALRAEAAAEGMRSLKDAALDLVREGVTTLEDVDRALGESSRAKTTEEASLPIEASEAADAGQATDDASPTEVPGKSLDPVGSVDLAMPAGGDALEPVAAGLADDGSDSVHVLLADDDPIIRQIARSLLRKNGFEVSEVEDGVAALERLNSDAAADQFDLVISDLDMPRLNGHDLLRLARGSARTAALPIVVLTSEEDPETEARLIEEGADDYIRKPIDAVRFLARVKAVLRRAGG